jgi:ATP/ADP translocase
LLGASVAGAVGSRERRDRLLEALFQVRPGELTLTALLFLHCFAVVGALTMGRALRDALFLAQFDKGVLPWMYVFQAFSVAGASSVYARFADKVRKDAMASGTALFLAASLLVFRAGIDLGHRWVTGVLYVWIEILAAIGIIQFWNLANEMFNPREAKRLFGIVGAGGTLATILLGPLMGPFAKRFGTETLLYPCAVLMLFAFGVARVIGRRNAARLTPKRTGKGAKASGGLMKIISSGHLRLVALIGAATFVTTTLVDYQFKAIAQAVYTKDQLTAFFGLFYGVCGVLSLFIQLGGTSRLLSRFGVVVALALLPLGLALGTSCLVLVPAALWAATWAKGSDNVIRYTINDATTQLLYLPVPAQVRGAAKATIDGVLKPGSIALAGLLLLGYRELGLGARPTAIITLVLIAGWMTGLASLRNQYVRSLQDTLRQRRLDLGNATSKLAEGAARKVIVRAFASQDAREVLNAIELLPHLPGLELDAHLDQLLEHRDPQVRKAILEHLARHPNLHLGNPVFRCFEDADAGVRAAAVQAFCAIGQDKAVRSVRIFLKDADPAIRSAAIAGMIRYGGLDGVLSAAEALKALIADPSPAMREHAARVLGEIGVRNFYQPVLELMADKQLSVKLAAIGAAGRLKSIELAPALVYRLDRAETSTTAVAALAEYGDAVVPILDRVLANHVEDLTIRRNVPRVLASIRTPAAMALLLQHLDDPDERLRSNVSSAIRRAARKNRALRLDRTRLMASVQSELGRGYAALAQAEALGLQLLPGGDTPRRGPEAARALLHSALLEKVFAVESRVFSLLTELYPDAGIEFVWAGIRDATQRDAARLRANAVELLDNVLDRDVKRRLLPLLEETPRDARLRAVAEVYPQPPRSAEAALLELLGDENAWVRACACMVAKEQRLASSQDALVMNLEAPWPVLREAALASVAELGRDDLPRLLERARHDDAAVVRARAEALSASAAPLRTA